VLAALAWLTARTAPLPPLVRGDPDDVVVTGGGLESVDGGPVTLPPRQGFETVLRPRVARGTCALGNGLRVRNRLGVTWRRRLAALVVGPEAVVAHDAGLAVVAGTPEARLRGYPKAAAHQVPLGVAPVWLFVLHEADARDEGQLTGSLCLVVADGGDVIPHAARLLDHARETLPQHADELAGMTPTRRRRWPGRHPGARSALGPGPGTGPRPGPEPDELIAADGRLTEPDLD
jgi:hypothetical protein